MPRRPDRKRVAGLGGADVALGFIKNLYRVEQKAKKLSLSPEDVLELCQNESKPILDEMRSWLLEKSVHVARKSLLGKAVHYALGQWMSSA